MTKRNRFHGKMSDLTITPPAKPAPVEPRVDTTDLRLKELRLHAGLTQEEVAEKMGGRRANDSRLENSQDARLSTIVAYLEAIGGSVEFVVDGHRETLKRVA